jgi:hypothetical protein
MNDVERIPEVPTGPKMSEEEATIRQDRNQVWMGLECRAKDMRRIAYEAKSYDEPGDEWPNTEPVPQHVWDALHALDVATTAMRNAVAETKRDYRKRVLEWLLAEMQAPLEAS